MSPYPDVALREREGKGRGKEEEGEREGKGTEVGKQTEPQGWKKTSEQMCARVRSRSCGQEEK